MKPGGSTLDAPPYSATEDDEAVLWLAFKAEGSAEAREALFSAYAAFAKQTARRHFLDRRNGDIEFQDLCQLAYAGLLEAMDHYDPAFGIPFKGYARRRISGSVLDGLAKMSETREQLSFRNRVRQERAQSLFTPSTGAMPADEAMQALTDLAVGLALGFMLDGAGLYVRESESAAGVTAYESLVWKDTMRRLATEVSRLPQREQQIIRHHYVTGLTFDQIGTLLGLSKGRISQMHRASIALLKKRLLNAGDFKLER